MNIPFFKKSEYIEFWDTLVNELMDKQTKVTEIHHSYVELEDLGINTNFTINGRVGDRFGLSSIIGNNPNSKVVAVIDDTCLSKKTQKRLFDYIQEAAKKRYMDHHTKLHEMLK